MWSWRVFSPLQQLPSSSSSGWSPALPRTSFPLAPPHHHPYHPQVHHHPKHHQPAHHPPPHHPPHHHMSQYQLHFLQPPPLPSPGGRMPPFQQKPLKSHRGGGGFHPKHARSASEIPPPLPARNRYLMHSQMSAPNMSTSLTSNMSTILSTMSSSLHAGLGSGLGASVSPTESLFTGVSGAEADTDGADGNSHGEQEQSRDDTLDAANINLSPTQSSIESQFSSTAAGNVTTATASVATTNSATECNTSHSAISSGGGKLRPGKSSSFNIRGSNLTASPSSVSTLSAPPSLCSPLPPPLPPRPAALGGPKVSAEHRQHDNEAGGPGVSCRLFVAVVSLLHTRRAVEHFLRLPAGLQ